MKKISNIYIEKEKRIRQEKETRTHNIEQNFISFLILLEGGRY